MPGLEFDKLFDNVYVFPLESMELLKSFRELVAEEKQSIADLILKHNKELIELNEEYKNKCWDVWSELIPMVGLDPRDVWHNTQYSLDFAYFDQGFVALRYKANPEISQVSKSSELC